MSQVNDFLDLKLKLASLGGNTPEAIRIYHEFKKLREEIGKPVGEKYDVDKIIKDLRGDGFAPLGKDERKKSRSKTGSRFIKSSLRRVK